MKGVYNMHIYSNNDETFVKVSMSSIKYLTYQLGVFLAIYEKKILLVTEEDRENFNQLKQLYQLLKEGRFDELISNPSYVIDFKVDDDEYLPRYYPI